MVVTTGEALDEGRNHAAGIECVEFQGKRGTEPGARRTQELRCGNCGDLRCNYFYVKLFWSLRYLKGQA